MRRCRDQEGPKSHHGLRSHMAWGPLFEWVQSSAKSLHTRSSYFFHSIGLTIVSSLLNPNSSNVEEKKVIIISSIWVALARCCVHGLPLAVSIILFWLNFNGSFIGAQLSGPSGVDDDVKFQILQFAAKAHELLIVASTATVIFHMIRNELIFGSGIPLGLLASGFSFSELGFFWYVDWRFPPPSDTIC